MKRAILASFLVAILVFSACATTGWSKIREDRRVILDFETGEPVAGAEVEVVVHRRETMTIELTETTRADALGRVRIPGKLGRGVVAASFGVKPAPREQSYWIRADGYLPTYVDLWSIREWQLVRAGEKIRVYPASFADSIPDKVEFRTWFVEKGTQSLFVPATATDGRLSLELLGVRGFLPLLDVFEECGCRDTIESRLAGAEVTVHVDEQAGLFVDWPESVPVYMTFEDGTDVGAWLIGEGLAVCDFRFDHSKRAEYERIEDEAVAAGKGVWGVLKAMGRGGE